MKYHYVVLFALLLQTEADHHLRGAGIKNPSHKSNVQDYIDIRYGPRNPPLDPETYNIIYLPMCFGIMVVILAVGILWYNERRLVLNYTRIDKSIDYCQSIDSNVIDPSCEGKLVYVRGKIDTCSKLIDKEFGIVEENCIKLERVVEMLLWIECGHSTYTQEWRREYKEPQGAGHTNDPKWIIESKVQVNPDVKLGAYILSDQLKNKYPSKQIIQPNEENIRQAELNFGKERYSIIESEGKFIMFKKGQQKISPGDMRVSFYKVPAVILLIFVLFIQCEADHHLRVDKTEFNHKRSSSSGNSAEKAIVTIFIMGCIGFPTTIALLWYNERRHVISQTRIENAMKDCQTGNSNEVDPRCNGKLVHTCGITNTNSLIVDQEFGVSEVKCVRIDRVVEMYQWIEHSERSDNRTSYSYTEEWRAHYVDSSSFSEYGHTNDKSKLTVIAQELMNPDLTLGAYQLSDSLKKQCSNKLPIQLNSENLRIAQNNYTKYNKHTIFQIEAEFIMFKQMIPVGDTTIVSQQTANTFQPYVFHDKFDQTIANAESNTDSSGCCGICVEMKAGSKPITEIDWIFEKQLDKNQAFKEKLSEESCMTYLTRLAGWFLMGLSLTMIFCPITFIFSYIPLFGKFLSAISLLMTCLTSYIIATPLSILIISIAWLYYRPIVGLIMITTAGLGISYIIYYIETHQNG